jgi:hypothetical protein
MDLYTKIDAGISIEEEEDSLIEDTSEEDDESPF